jgi:hypothetical protein
MVGGKLLPEVSYTVREMCGVDLRSFCRQCAYQVLCVLSNGGREAASGWPTHGENLYHAVIIWLFFCLQDSSPVLCVLVDGGREAAPRRSMHGEGSEHVVC